MRACLCLCACASVPVPLACACICVSVRAFVCAVVSACGVAFPTPLPPPPPRAQAPVPRGQRRRVGAGHLQGPRDHAPRCEMIRDCAWLPFRTVGPLHSAHGRSGRVRDAQGKAEAKRGKS
eukprot:6200627-Pleurochrysis_carterae.AAC.2